MAEPGGKEAELGCITRNFLNDPTRTDGWVKTFIVEPGLQGSEVGFTADGIRAISPKGLVALVRTLTESVPAAQNNT